MIEDENHIFSFKKQKKLNRYNVKTQDNGLDIEHYRIK